MLSLIFRVDKNYLQSNTPKKTGDQPWKIVDDESGKVLDSYMPQKVSKPKSFTPYEGYWAWAME